MNSFNEYNKDYEIFKTHYNGLNELREAINLEIRTLADDEHSTSTIRKLLKLREFINEAITFCGETMFDGISLMIHQLKHMKEDFNHAR